MNSSLHIILEQPTPKSGATRIFRDIQGGSNLPTPNNDANSTSTTSHAVSQKCKRLHKPGEAELIPEPFKSDLESAVTDAESNDASSYVADHLCYMDEDSPYLALAGRTQSGDDFYFPLTQEGSDWRWIDHEDRSGSPKAKPFEQY